LACSSCGKVNEAGRKFCIECGQPLGIGCPTCGASLPPDAKFCGECGTRVGGSPSADTSIRPAVERPALAPTPVSERRVVSVLFADLVGFTTLAEGRDAEDTRELLSRYFDLSREVIARYGGTVEKFIGDAVMAVWGAPTAHEDDAERAVRAGLDLVDAVRTLGTGVEARAGVLTGEAAVTLGATNEGMVAGDLVNTASRLQSVAPPGTVLVGEATQRAASMAVIFEEAGDLTLKGKVSPVPAWRAVRIVAERGGRNRAERLEAPFVGRDDEFRQIKDLFHATGRDRRARLVSVIGPAGIGKTRLAWELLKYIDGLVDTVLFHDGRSPAYGEGVSFWALGEMVRGRAGLLETDDEPTTRAKIAETVTQYVHDEAERLWIEEALLALLGLETVSSGPEQLFAAWRTFFERLAISAPVALIFEDHHYADPGLLDFVDHLLEWSRNVPIYVVTLSRPDLLERRPDWGAGKRNFTSIYLDPLSEPSMRELLSGLVPGLPPTAVTAILERAGGIPLYAVETIRMLVAEGRLAIEEGVYRPVGDLTTLAVPETLTALIASRLDGLVADDRALISDAAVLGQSFSVAGLSAVSGIAETEIEARLRTLVRKELVTLESDPRSPERGQYVFVQALIREVAYNTLAKRDRKIRHLAAARFFESLDTDEVAGALAGHYLAAHANATEGPEADALAGQARIALRGAADRAIALGSHGQAVSLMRQALSVTTDPTETAELLERAGDVASQAGDHDEAERFLLQATQLDRERGDRAATARATAALARAYLTGRRTAEAVAVLEPAVIEFADFGDHPALAALHSQLARACVFAGDARRAVEMADRALDVAEHGDHVALLADTLITKGTALGDLGRIQEGIGVIETGERLAQSAGLVATRVRGINNRTIIQAEIEPAAVLDASADGLALSRRMGHHYWALAFSSGLGYACYRCGQWDRAVTVLGDALAEDMAPEDRIQVLGNVVLVPAFRGDDVADILIELDSLLGSSTELSLAANVREARGAAALASGRLHDAIVEYRTCAELMTNVGASDPRMYAFHAALWAGDIAEARAESEAIAASGFRAPTIEARRSTMRAGLAAAEGRQTEALGLYRDAIRRWQELGLVVDEALAGIDMVTMLDPELAEVRAVGDSTRDFLAAVRAKPLLDRLEAAISRPASVEVRESSRSRDASNV
jgi:class 3 adenylate cyclase/tetratricopeptide (TPR) repeat protein